MPHRKTCQTPLLFAVLGFGNPELVASYLSPLDINSLRETCRDLAQWILPQKVYIKAIPWPHCTAVLMCAYCNSNIIPFHSANEKFSFPGAGDYTEERKKTRRAYALRPFCASHPYYVCKKCFTNKWCLSQWRVEIVRHYTRRATQTIETIMIRK